MTFGEKVAELGWQTGSVIPLKELHQHDITLHLTRPGQQPTLVSENDWLVVASQTCDTRAHSLIAEPFVEILHCRLVAGKPRKGRRDLESTRYLDFRPNRATHSNLVLEAHATVDRYVFPRSLLIKFAPDPDRNLSANSAQKILAWYALRAGRPSWPDKFCDRLRLAQTSLEDALDDLSDEIAEVRIAIREKDEELNNEQTYHVVVFFVVDEEIWNEDVNGRNSIYAAFSKFITVLSACNGIEVNQDESDVISGDKFSWQMTKQTDLWDFANLSHRDI